MAGKIPILFVVWEKLSSQCRKDLVYAEGREGSIIRCTEEDFELIKFMPFTTDNLVGFMSFEEAQAENKDGS